jgi:Fe2+ transport system protein FeoA
MTVRLSDCRRGDRVRIVKINAGRGAVLNLMNLGLDVGHRVELVQRSPLRGPLLVSHDGTEVAIGYRLGEKILVEKADAD